MWRPEDLRSQDSRIELQLLGLVLSILTVLSHLSRSGFELLILLPKPPPCAAMTGKHPHRVLCYLVVVLWLFEGIHASEYQGPQTLKPLSNSSWMPGGEVTGPMWVILSHPSRTPIDCKIPPSGLHLRQDSFGSHVTLNHLGMTRKRSLLFRTDSTPTDAVAHVASGLGSQHSGGRQR